MTKQRLVRYAEFFKVLKIIERTFFFLRVKCLIWFEKMTHSKCPRSLQSVLNPIWYLLSADPPSNVFCRHRSALWHVSTTHFYQVESLKGVSNIEQCQFLWSTGNYHMTQIVLGPTPSLRSGSELIAASACLSEVYYLVSLWIIINRLSRYEPQLVSRDCL